MHLCLFFLNYILTDFTVKNTFELSKGVGNMHYSIKTKVSDISYKL